MGFARVACAHDVSAMMKASMAFLKAEADKMGPPRLEGLDKIADNDVPVLYFGATKMNNNFALVDEVAKQSGAAAAAITVGIFVVAR